MKDPLVTHVGIVYHPTAAQEMYASLICDIKSPDNDVDRAEILKISPYEIEQWKRLPAFVDWLEWRTSGFFKQYVPEVWRKVLDIINSSADWKQQIAAINLFLRRFDSKYGDKIDLSLAIKQVSRGLTRVKEVTAVTIEPEKRQ